MKLLTYILVTLTALCFNFINLNAQTTDSLALTEPQQETESSMSMANEAYKNKNFEESIKLYEAEISKNRQLNRQSAQLYYNLGNAYFRDNQIAKAIVNYERALLLEPGDSDIQHNLRFAKTRIEDKIDSADSFIINQWVRSLQNLFNANTWAILAIVFFILLILSIGVYMISSRLILRKVSFYSGIVLLSFVVITNVFAFRQKNKIVNRSTGIIMAPSVSIYTSPDVHSQELFRLHEGAKVKIKRQESNWFEITIANGSVGWLQKKSVETI